jgi:hypothetical protein
MKEKIKKAKKTMGKKLYKEIKEKFPSKNKLRQFCKRHPSATKEFFEQKLETIKTTPMEKQKKKKAE